MRIRRILGATGGTPCGEHAVAVARSLAQAADAEFIRLAVETENTPANPTPGWSPAPSPGGGTITRVRGLPGVEIVRHAETQGTDLVVLGRRPRDPDQPDRVGRTSDTVIRKRGGLSLLVPPHTSVVRRALIAVDGSLRGLGVVAPAVPFLNLIKAETSAICVLPGDTLETTSTWRDIRHERASVLVELMRLDSGPCELLVRWGDPVAEVLKAVRELRADVLILGVRRGGKAGDLGSGYIGRELLKSVPCAVLTVPI